jgi:hypothetical protein
VSKSSYFVFFLLKLTHIVYRVNWLRAKARVDRWQEEVILVENEMQWTLLWFQNQANLWRERGEREDSILPMGHTAYAKKQYKLWNTFQTKSSERFSLYLP